MKTNHDPAVVAAHVATLAETFATTPATVRRWLAEFETSPMPEAVILANEIRRHPRGKRRATLYAAERIVAGCKNHFGAGFREGLKRDLPPLKAIAKNGNYHNSTTDFRQRQGLKHTVAGETKTFS